MFVNFNFYIATGEQPWLKFKVNQTCHFRLHLCKINFWISKHLKFNWQNRLIKDLPILNILGKHKTNFFVLFYLILTFLKLYLTLVSVSSLSITQINQNFKKLSFFDKHQTLHIQKAVHQTNNSFLMSVEETYTSVQFFCNSMNGNICYHYRYPKKHAVCC